MKTEGDNCYDIISGKTYWQPKPGLCMGNIGNAQVHQVTSTIKHALCNVSLYTTSDGFCAIVCIRRGQ